MAKTLQNLRDMVRIEIRDPDGINFPDDRIDHNINQEYFETFHQIANALKEHFITIASQNIVADQREYAFPSNTLRILRVEMVINNAWIPLERYKRGITINYTSGPSYSLGFIVPSYDIEGSNIVLEPTPGTSLTDGLRVTVVNDPTALAAANDTVHAQFKDFWCHLVALRASKACFTQVEAVGGIVAPGNIDERLQRLEKEVLDSITFRTASPVFKRRKRFFQ